MSNSEFSLNRQDLLVSLNKLKSVNKAFGADVSFVSRGDELMVFTYHEGLTAVELIPVNCPDFIEVTVSMDKLYEFVSCSIETNVYIKLTDKTLTINDSDGFGRLPKKVVIINVNLPEDNDLVVKLKSDAFDYLSRVANISDSKNSARPILGGVLMTLANGEIRVIAANGVAFGYAWYLDDDVIVYNNESVLINATALSYAQKYSWNSDTIYIYRPQAAEDKRSSKVIFSNGKNSYLIISELAEKEKYPAKFVFDASQDSGGKSFFEADSSLFKAYVSAAIGMSSYEERVVTVSLLNGMLYISSGRRTEWETRESGVEFDGFSKKIKPHKFGEDFVLSIDSKVVNQVVTLLEQVDKGSVVVSKGTDTHLIFFSTPTANALYGVAPMVR